MRSFHEDLLHYAAGAPDQPTWPGSSFGWRTLTEAGNRALAADDFPGALGIYRQALAEAERLFEAAEGGGPPLLAPMIYNISCANAAAAAARSGDKAAARGWMLLAIRRLLAAAEGAASPVALRVNCVRHLRYSFGIVSRDFCGEADDGEIDALVARATAVLDVIRSLTDWVDAEAGAERPGEAPGAPSPKRRLQ